MIGERGVGSADVGRVLLLATVAAVLQTAGSRRQCQ